MITIKATSNKPIIIADSPSLLNLPKVNSKPNENIKKIIPSSASNLISNSSSIKEKGGV
ncbi:Uncharacterized protein NCS13_1_0276 [Neochlamydia sp. S13]|nr:Uncharacterized protein NCS13_1_0276 [Neochlamydia sp. S13]